MNNEQLKRTLGLLRRTGDRGIVLDPGSDEVFVLIDADSYEKILGVNQPTTPSGDGFEDYVLDDLLDMEERREKPVEIRSNSEKPSETPKKEQKLSFTDDWANKKNAILSEESLSDVPHEEEEEEKFYLEAVE